MHTFFYLTVFQAFKFLHAAVTMVLYCGIKLLPAMYKK